MAQRDSAVWRYRFNKKKEKSTKETSRRIHTNSRVVTNDQGLVEAEEDRAKQLEKKRKEEEKQARKSTKQKEDLVRRATQGSTRVFSGAISAVKNKTELEDIADALKISIAGTKAILVARIVDYFNEHPRFKEDPRFIGLFSRGRKRPAPDDDENANPTSSTILPPPAQRARLSSSTLGAVTNTHSRDLAHYQPSNSDHQFVPNAGASSSRVVLEDLPPHGPSYCISSQMFSQYNPV